jgi:trigger factor
MEYSLQRLDKSRVEIALSIGKEEWDSAIREAYEKHKHSYKIDGFRPGKVPFNLIVNRYGKQFFYEDALDIAVGKAYSEIMGKEKGVEPLGKPDIDIGEVEEDGVKAVIATDVYPEVKLGEYKGLKFQKVPFEVTDADVERELNDKREASCRYIDVTERPAKTGDRVIIDYSGSVGGVKFDGGTAEKQTLDLGAGKFIPGFEAQVEGMKTGEEKDIAVTFPADYHADDLAGKEAIFHIKLHEIKLKELPAIDDEFAKDVSEFDSLEAYKADIKANLLKDAELKARYEEDDKIIETITESTAIDIPQTLIEEEIDRNIDDLGMRMSYSGYSLDAYLKSTNTTLEKLRDERREISAKNVKTRLVLEGIIKAEGLKIEKEELDAEVTKLAEKTNKTPEEYKKGMNEYDAGRIMNRLLGDKIFEYLRANNTIE